MTQVMKRTALALLMLLTAVCNGQTGQPAGKARDDVAAAAEAAYARLSRADEAREANDWTEASRLYREALAAYAELTVAHPEWQPAVMSFRIAYCKKQIEKVAQLTVKAGRAAEPAARPAAVSSPDASEESALRGAVSRDVRKLSDAAVAHLRAGRTAEARRALMDALRRDPDAVSVRLLLGLAQCQAGDFGDAAYVLGPLVEECPDSVSARLAMGAALLGQGKTDEAIVHARRAIELSPGLAVAHLDMARLLLTTQPADAAGARVHYDRAISLGAERAADLEAQLKSPAVPAFDPARVEESLSASPTSSVPEAPAQ